MKDDTISRAAAISEVKKLCEGCYLSEHCGKCLTKCLVRKSINQLKKVPPSQPSATDTNVGGNLIDRQAAIDALNAMKICRPLDSDRYVISDCMNKIAALSSVQPEPLTDKEQRIFLAAMDREEKVCKQVDDECRDCREPYEDSLVRTCHEIVRKVKGALWT